MKARVPKQNMGGGAQNMNAMIKQAQKMQDEITKLQDDIEEREFSATAGGGAVEVVLYGKKNVADIQHEFSHIAAYGLKLISSIKIHFFRKVSVTVSQFSNLGIKSYKAFSQHKANTQNPKHTDNKC